jgi:catechol 2,3-dioxygenase-like lactoylglutathione lyase family enzyme
VIHHPETTPSPTTEIPGPDLFITVIKVADWHRAVDWYVEILGLLAVLTDHQNQFALLAAGNGRLGLQGDSTAGSAGSTHGTRLVFLVPEVDVEHQRLTGLGVEVGLPVDNMNEGYREIRLHDPEGTPLTLFSWTGRSRGQRPEDPA